MNEATKAKANEMNEMNERLAYWQRQEIFWQERAIYWRNAKAFDGSERANMRFSASMIVTCREMIKIFRELIG